MVNKEKELIEKFKLFVYPFSPGSGHLTGTICEETRHSGAEECVKIAVDFNNETKKALKEAVELLDLYLLTWGANAESSKAFGYITEFIKKHEDGK